MSYPIPSFISILLSPSSSTTVLRTPSLGTLFTAMALLTFKLLPAYPPSPSPSLSYPNQGLPYSCRPTLRILCAKRTGKQRYPSEKRKVKLKHKEIIGEVKEEDKFQGIWRLSNLGVPLHKDPGKDFLGVSEALLQEIAKVLEFPVI